jgi:hypothetical protein
VSIRQHRRPCSRGVTGFARLRGNEVFCTLADSWRMRAIVTGLAGALNLAVIKDNTGPICGDMAAVTIVRCREVRWIFASSWRLATVVT